MKKIAAAAATAISAMALVGATQGAAQAAPSTTRAAAPSCVKADVTYLVTIMVDVTNNCSTTQKVKVDFNNNYFSSCMTLAPGQVGHANAAIFQASRYEGLVTC
ncbi:hypothetical protein ABVG11_21050 [Streptomyces sp. HD1123-B1]|uniref:hypothetical protein n=1 Tax=Streptomyces TaxID=1883 RepID=UPI0020C8B604|nr:hypothetical protein [Streptomyces sp. NEAU-Y11]MCP9206901.1 hypothetical protein [Streptomyces sp. NEAU-Y11]